jgi:hypothetical protein
VLARRVLYDLKGWESALFYYIGFGGREITLRRYWGARRHSGCNRVPISAEVRELINGCSPQQASELLKGEFGRKSGEGELNMAVTSSAIWIRL